MALGQLPGELGENPLVKAGDVVTRLLNDQGSETDNFALDQSHKDDVKNLVDNVNNSYSEVTPGLVQEFQDLLDSWIDDVYNDVDGVNKRHLESLSNAISVLVYNYLGEEFSKIPYIEQQEEPTNPYDV